MKKLRYKIVKYLHYILPSPILMNALWFSRKLPIIWRLVAMFDPNVIRKEVGFSLTEREIKLRSKRWNLLVNPRDHIGFRSYLNDEPFEMAVYDVAEKLRSTNRKVVLDIGANIGTASVPICSKNGLELIAIEASKGNAKLLAQNILNNEVKAKVFLYALVDEVKDDYVKLYINKGNTGSNSLLETWNPSKGPHKNVMVEYVPSKTLDEVIIDTRLCTKDLIVVKIDVEGMEEAVLNGAKDFLAKNTAPIILEYRSDAVELYTGKSMSGVVAILTEFNYKLYALGNKADLFEFDETKSYENIIALKEGSDFSKILV